MSIHTAIDNENRVYMYFTPRDKDKMSIRTHPYRLHLPPKSVDQFDVPFLYTICRGIIDRDYFQNCLVNKDQADRWSLYYGKDVTVISFDDYMYKNNRDGFRFYPFEDLEVVIGMVVEDAVTVSDIDWKMLPHLYPYSSVKVKNASIAGELDWLHPVWDATNREDMYWVASPDALIGNMTAAKHQLDRSTLFDLIDSQGVTVSKSKAIPDKPMERQSMFGIDHYVGETDSDIFDSHYPLGIKPPVEKPNSMVGESFEHDGKTWTFKEVYEPISPGVGWMFEIESEDGFVSGLTQFAYEVFFEEVDLNDMVPWYFGTVTYLELFGEFNIDESDLLDWTRFHRRKYLQGQDKDVVKIKEYRDSDYWISKYQWNGSRYDRVRREQWDAWNKQRTLGKLKSKSQQTKLDRLKGLAEKSKSKKKIKSSKNKKQIDALKKLL